MWNHWFLVSRPGQTNLFLELWKMWVVWEKYIISHTKTSFKMAIMFTVRLSSSWGMYLMGEEEEEEDTVYIFLCRPMCQKCFITWQTPDFCTFCVVNFVHISPACGLNISYTIEISRWLLNTNSRNNILDLGLLWQHIIIDPKASTIWQSVESIGPGHWLPFWKMFLCYNLLL